MSTAGRSDTEVPAASDIAAQLRSAEFVRLVAAGTGDGVTAATTLARALGGQTPYQLSVTPLPDTTDRDTQADYTLAVGRPARRADSAIGTGSKPASLTAHEVAAELGRPDPVSAIAGALAAGHARDETILGIAEAADLSRRPGVAIPTTDLADGLAHSIRLRVPFSGSPEAASDELGALDLPDVLGDDERRRVASFVALSVTAPEASERATASVEQVLRPLVGGPFETVGGYADVLEATARETPGEAVALAFGHAETESALPTWRAHARDAHGALSSATTGRYDGLFAVTCTGSPPVGTVARLAAGYRSPEPVVIALGDDIAEATRTHGSTTHVGQALQQAATELGGTADGTPTRGSARFETDSAEFLLAFREAL